MFSRRSRFYYMTVVVVALTAALGLLVLLGRGRVLVPDWYGPGPITPSAQAIVIALLTLSIYLVGARLLSTRAAPLYVGWAALGSVATCLALLNLTANPLHLLFACVDSQGCTGGFDAGLRLTPALVHDWVAFMRDSRLSLPHVAISAPGWPLLYRGLTDLLHPVPGLSHALAAVLRPLRCDQGTFQALADNQIASAWLGIASPLWAALTVVPLYSLGRSALGEQPARRAVALWPLLPAPALFAATQSNVYALLATSIVALFWSGLAASGPRRRAWRLVLAGAMFGLSLLLTFSLAPVLLVCGLLALWVAARHSDCLPRVRARERAVAAVCAGLQMGAGWLAVWAAFWLVTRASPVAIFFAAMRIHTELAVGYFTGLALHSWDFAMFAGLPVVGLALLPALDRRFRRGNGLVLVTGLSLLLLLLSGTARGEVGRVWIFLMPLVVLAAARGLEAFAPRQRLWLLAAQAAWLVALAASFTPVNSFLILPDYAAVAPPPLAAAVTPTDAVFGGVMRLTGYQSVYEPGTHTLKLALHWQALRTDATPYYFSVVPVAPGGRTLPGVHWQPFDARFPTSCWRPDQSRQRAIVDNVTLDLGTDARPGNWWLSLSAFPMNGDQAAATLPVVLPDGARDVQVGLGPLDVPGAP